MIAYVLAILVIIAALIRPIQLFPEESLSPAQLAWARECYKFRNPLDCRVVASQMTDQMTGMEVR